MRAWETLFQHGGLGLHEDLFEVINPKTVRKSDPRLSALILQLYSMETFLFDVIAKTAQNEDESKIKHIGPFACVLRALLFTNVSVQHDTIAYRGVLLTPEQFEYLQSMQ